MYMSFIIVLLLITDMICGHCVKSGRTDKKKKTVNSNHCYHFDRSHFHLVLYKNGLLN